MTNHNGFVMKLIHIVTKFLVNYDVFLKLHCGISLHPKTVSTGV